MYMQHLSRACQKNSKFISIWSGSLRINRLQTWHKHNQDGHIRMKLCLRKHCIENLWHSWIFTFCLASCLSKWIFYVKNRPNLVCTSEHLYDLKFVSNTRIFIEADFKRKIFWNWNQIERKLEKYIVASTKILLKGNMFQTQQCKESSPFALNWLVNKVYV